MSERDSISVPDDGTVTCPHKKCGKQIYRAFVRNNGYCPACSGKLEHLPSGQVEIPKQAGSTA